MNEQETLAKLRLHLYPTGERPAEKNQSAVSLSEMLAESALTLIRTINDVTEAPEYEQQQGIAFIVMIKGFLVECQKCARQWTIEIGTDGHFSTLCPNGCNGHD